jgi:hypothetical protein
MYVYQSLCYTYACPSPSAFVLHLSACKSPAHAAPVGGVCIFSGLFVAVVSISVVRNTETNQTIYLWFHEEKTLKNNRNKLSFGSFQFKPKIFFVFFDDTTLVLIKTKQTKSAKI